MSRLLKINGLFRRISSLLHGSFAKETYNFKEPTNRGHPILMYETVVLFFDSLSLTHTYTYTYSCTHTHTHKTVDTAYLILYTQVYTHIHTHIHTNIHTHIHIHTHFTQT